MIFLLNMGIHRKQNKTNTGLCFAFATHSRARRRLHQCTPPPSAVCPDEWALHFRDKDPARSLGVAAPPLVLRVLTSTHCLATIGLCPTTPGLRTGVWGEAHLCNHKLLTYTNRKTSRRKYAKTSVWIVFLGGGRISMTSIPCTLQVYNDLKSLSMMKTLLK